MLSRLRTSRTPKRLAAIAAAAVLGAVPGTVIMASSAAAQQPVVNPAWGVSLPPADAPLSQAYQLILDEAAGDKGYAPRAGECSLDIHALYWTYGPDGKVYPTWHDHTHPATGCAFGHEHGDDPRNAGALFDELGFTPFGYTSEVMKDNMPEASQRHEDHVGHKTLARSPFNIYENDNGTSFFEPTNTPVRTSCDLLVKYHQGLHSPDAFTNNLHEVFYAMSCSDGVEVRLATMMPIGEPGRFIATDCPGQAGNPNSFTDGTVFNPGPAVPADSPDAPAGTYGRMITDSRCVDAIRAGEVHYEILVGTNVPFSTVDLHEFWFSNYQIQGAGVTNFYMGGTLFYALDPERHFDPTKPNNLAYNVDICYDIPNIVTANQDFKCAEAQRLSQQRLPYDDVRSPFKGGTRDIRLGQITVNAPSTPTTIYTDVFGKNPSTTPFAGSIQQMFAGNQSYPLVRGETSGKNWAAAGGTTHSPN